MNKQANPLLKKHAKTLLIVGVLALVSLAYVWAAEPSGATLTANRSLGEYPAFIANSISAESGNITLANIESNFSTYRWAGVVGNVSGNIVLGDGSSFQLFAWIGAGKVVYAAQSLPSWGTLSDANASNVTGHFNWLTTGYDNYTSTFTGAVENIGSNIFPTLASDYAQTRSSGAATFKTYSLVVNLTNTPVFAAYVVEDGASYIGGQTFDYQMIIPENGTFANSQVSSWNLYVELQ